MPNKILKQVKTIVISAGHGLKDPGAISGAYLEKDETFIISQKVIENLRKENLKVDYLDRDAIVKNPKNGNDVLIQKINHINKNYSSNDWVIEIHRDSAEGLASEQANTQFGVYYFGGSADSQAVAEDMVKTLKDNGAFRSSWSRPDTVARFGSLGWIRDTKPTAHLIECGFMQGEHTEERLTWYATLATEAIYKAFTGNDYSPKPQEKPIEPAVPLDNLPQYPRDENPIDVKFPNLKDYPIDYQNAIRNNDIGWILNSLIDRDKEVAEFKKKVSDLDLLVSKLKINSENNLEEDMKTISDLKIENTRLASMYFDLQNQLAGLVQENKDLKNISDLKIKTLEDKILTLGSGQTPVKTKRKNLLSFLDEKFKNLIDAVKNNKNS